MPGTPRKRSKQAKSPYKAILGAFSWEMYKRTGKAGNRA